MLVFHVLFYVLLANVHVSYGMIQASKKFEDSWENPWDPLWQQKQLYKEAYTSRDQGDMDIYLQFLEQAAQPVGYTSYNCLRSESRKTGYFKAEYDFARILDKKGNISKALPLYARSLRHSRFNTEEKAPEIYKLSADRVEEIFTNNPDNAHAAIILAREYLTALNSLVVSRGFDLLEYIVNNVPEEEQFQLFEKYGWHNVLDRIISLDHKNFAARRALAFFHVGQLKQYGICGSQKKSSASCYYAQALKDAQSNDRFQARAERNLQTLAFAQQRDMCSIGEYMEYAQLNKNWESYCCIGSSFLDDCNDILDAVYKEISFEGFYNVDKTPISIEIFDKHYPGLFITETELDDTISEELQFKLTMLKVRYLVLKAKEYRVNASKNPETDVVPAYQAAINGYCELAKLSKQKYVFFNFKQQHADLCSVAGMYASNLFRKKTSSLLMTSALNFYYEAYQLGDPRGSCMYALIALMNEAALDDRKVKAYSNILETNAPKVDEPGELYKQMYLMFSGESVIQSNVNIKNLTKAKEYAQKGAQAGNDYCAFKYGLLLLKDKDVKKHEEGDLLIKKAVKNKLPEAIVWLKLKKIDDVATNPDCDGKIATENLRKFINTTDYETFVNLENHELFKKIQTEVVKKNKLFGSIIAMTITQRSKNEQDKLYQVVKLPLMDPIFVSN